MKTTTAGYSISEEAYSMLQNHSEQRYGKDGIAGHVIVDAIRYNLETDDTDTFEKQQYNDLTADLEGFSFTRGETKEVHFRVQENLLDQFRRQARQVYSQRKIGKYLSRCVYVYIYERSMKSYEAVDTVTSDVAEELYENYTGLDYIPDIDAQIPKSKKYTIPLFITILKSQNTSRYAEKLIEAAGNNITDYVDISDRTIDSYIDSITSTHMAEIPNIWTGINHIDMDKKKGYILRNEENQEIQDYVDDWANKIIEFVTNDDRTKSDLEKIQKYAKINIERYEDTEIDTSAVQEVDELIEELIDEGDYIW